MRKKILVTGGAGFIGSNLVLKLLEKGYQITVVDNLSPQIHGMYPEKESFTFKEIMGKVTFVKGTVLDRELMVDLVVDQNIVVHLAAETGTGQSMYEIHHYTNTNVGGTALILDILANTDNQVEKMIVASSRALYGEGKYQTESGEIIYPECRNEEAMFNGVFEVMYRGKPLILLPTNEESKIHPSSVYGITKQTQEQLVMTVCPTIGIAPVAFRYQNVYGPGQSLKNPYTGILSIFSNLVLSDHEINIFEDGQESRDFVYIDDVVDATILGIESGLANQQIFNVGTGVRTSVLTVVERLMRAYDRDVKVRISGNFRRGDIRHNYADINKISAVLGFSPKVSFSQGIVQFTDWVVSQNIQDNHFNNSLKEMQEKGLLK